jgi:hypothetical protein
MNKSRAISERLQLSEITSDDLENSPVWRTSRGGELLVAVHKTKLPLASLTGMLVATKVRLASGFETWVLVGNLGVDQRSNEHFATFSFHSQGQWFHLARYHDFDYPERGPSQLAAFLGMDVVDVFPFVFNVRGMVRGGPLSLSGCVDLEPRERLSEDQLVELALSPTVDPSAT